MRGFHHFVLDNGSFVIQVYMSDLSFKSLNVDDGKFVAGATMATGTSTYS